ncbi:DNA fragmentation factor subunit alpha-like isoform X3 [Branchiostoma floridae x Branchiostoma japonicum]
MYAAQGKAFRVWDGERKVKVGVVARSLHELKSKGRQHLNLPEEEDLSIVLEEDGTVVADNEFFQFIPDQTVVQLLTEGQEWRPEAPDDVTQTDGTDEADTAGPIVDLSTDTEVKQLCRKLRQDIAAIVSFTPFQLELLSDADVEELTSQLELDKGSVEQLQEACQQRVLDRRRTQEAVELLQLFREVPEAGGNGQDATDAPMSVVASEGTTSNNSTQLVEQVRAETRRRQHQHKRQKTAREAAATQDL